MLVKRLYLTHFVTIHGVAAELAHMFFHLWVWHDGPDSLAASLIVIPGDSPE